MNKAPKQRSRKAFGLAHHLGSEEKDRKQGLLPTGKVCLNDTSD